MTKQKESLKDKVVSSWCVGESVKTIAKEYKLRVNQVWQILADYK